MKPHGTRRTSRDLAGPRETSRDLAGLPDQCGLPYLEVASCDYTITQVLFSQTTFSSQKTKTTTHRTWTRSGEFYFEINIDKSPIYSLIRSISECHRINGSTLTDVDNYTELPSISWMSTNVFSAQIRLKAVIHRPFRTAELASYGDRAYKWEYRAACVFMDMTIGLTLRISADA